MIGALIDMKVRSSLLFTLTSRFTNKLCLFCICMYLHCSFDNTVLAYEQNVWGPDGLCVHCASLAARPKHQFANRIHYIFRKKYSFRITPVYGSLEWNQIQNLRSNTQYSNAVSSALLACFCLKTKNCCEFQINSHEYNSWTFVVFFLYYSLASKKSLARWSIYPIYIYNYLIHI